MHASGGTDHCLNRSIQIKACLQTMSIFAFFAFGTKTLNGFTLHFPCFSISCSRYFSCSIPFFKVLNQFFLASEFTNCECKIDGHVIYILEIRYQFYCITTCDGSRLFNLETVYVKRDTLIEIGITQVSATVRNFLSVQWADKIKCLHKITSLYLISVYFINTSCVESW